MRAMRTKHAVFVAGIALLVVVGYEVYKKRTGQA
jgi:hypothetical protein